MAPEVVLVTGSAGLIGRRLIERLAPRYTMVGFDREGHSRHPPPVAECICIDLTDQDKLKTAMQRVRYAYGTRIASVVHLAAYYDFTGEPSPLYDEVTVGGTRKLLRALQGFDVEQLVFSSTMLVHEPSPGPGHPIREARPLDPKWPYPESKVKTERLLEEEHGRVPVAVLRIAGVYDERCHSPPLAHQMQRIYEDDPLGHLFPGNPSHGQAFVHLEDTVDAIARAVDRRHQLPAFAPILIGEETTLSYARLQHLFGEHLRGRPWETRPIPKALAKTGAWLQDAMPGSDPFVKPFMIDIADDHYELDTSRAHQLLGWRPHHALEETIPRMARLLREDPRTFYRENGLRGAPPGAGASPARPAQERVA